MTLRPATSADADLLADLNRHVHDLHVAAEPDLYRDHDPAAIADFFREQLAGDVYGAIIAESAGTPMGCVCYRIHRAPAHTFSHARCVLFVDQLVVVPHARGTGLGRQLMAAIEAEARRQGIGRVELDVRAFNRDAFEFYAACGYTPVMHRLGRKL